MITVKCLVCHLIDKKEHYPLSDEFAARYQQSKGGYIDFAHKTGHLVDVQKHEPNQKWHFFESWLLQSFRDGSICWENDAGKVVYRRIQCPELLLWILEAAGVDLSKVEAAKEIAERGKESGDRPATIAKGIREQVPWELVEDVVKSQC